MLDLNLSCAKDFRNLNSMVTWCINWRRLLALIISAQSIKIISHCNKIGYSINCNRLHAWWSTLSRLTTLLSSLIASQRVGLRTLWLFPLKALSIDKMAGTWSFGCYQAHCSLPVGFLLLWYSVLCRAESVSLLYLLFISWFICSRRWCIDK